MLNGDNSKLEPSKERLKNSYGYLACLTRNRDFNENGQIDGDELRWYTPARDQMLGLWIGEPALPAKAALLPYPTTNNLSHGSTSNYPIYTSTSGNNRVIWAEEGCSFGPVNQAGGHGYVRVVRNLGATPSVNSHTTDAKEYYSYNSSDRTITLWLSDNALRAFSNRELAPHHERSVVNRPYRKFQVAKQPYTKEVTATCSGHSIHGSAQKKYEQLQTTDVTRAKSDVTTIAAQYRENGEQDVNTAAWRLPNQRELALMVVAMGNSMDYDMDNETFHHMNYECKNGYWGAFHDWEYTNNYVLHCRTSFSNTDYTAFGYIYHTGDKHIRMYGSDIGSDGMGGYLCVRDVQN